MQSISRRVSAIGSSRGLLATVANHIPLLMNKLNAIASDKCRLPLKRPFNQGTWRLKAMHSHASVASMSSDRKRRLVENISRTYPLNKFRGEIKGNLFKAAATPNIGSTRNQLPGDWGNSLGVLANLFHHEVASNLNTQSNGIDVQNTMDLGAEELESIDEVMKNAQELRRLGRKYLIRCKKPWEIKSGLYELGCQAWHVGTAILLLNQDHKAHMLLSYSMRRWTDQLIALLKRMHPELHIVERRGSIKVTSREPYSDQPSTAKKNERRAEKSPKTSKHRWAAADPRLPGQHF